MEQNKPILPTFFSDLKDAFRDKGGKITISDDRTAFALWQRASTGKKRSIVYAVKAGSFFRPRLDRLIADFPEAPTGNDGSIYTVIDSAETVECEYCGKTLPKSEATFYEAAGIYACPDCAENKLTHCARCGEMISYDDSYTSPYGRLCECCYDDLFV